MLFLGIDGGSTKLDFSLVDEQARQIFSCQITKASNLKYVGAATLIANLDEGLNLINNAGISLNQISWVYAGIAECAPKNPHPQLTQVSQWFLQKFGTHFTLEDDQYSVFRSLSTGATGILANAGTGSNLNYFSQTTEQTIKSIGFGGRDFGKALLALCYNGVFTSGHPVYEALRSHVSQDPIEYFDSLQGRNFVINSSITTLPKVVQKAYDANELSVRTELHPLLVTMGTRWGSKISAYCLSNFGFSPDDTFEIVLRGGLWSWAVMRTVATQDVLKTFPHAHILYDQNIPAVKGCTYLAKQYFDAQN